MPKTYSPRKKSRLGCTIPLLLLSVLLLWLPVEAYFSNNVIKLQRVTLTLDRLPAAFDGWTILHLSDLHEKTFGTENEDLLNKAKGAEPDLIVITGDLYQSDNGPAYAAPLFAALMDIAPVYYVTGNHEWAAEWRANSAGTPSLREAMDVVFAETGVAKADGQCIPLKREGGTLVLTGLCDPNGPMGSLTTAGLRQRATAQYGDAFTLLLSHRNDMFDQYVQQGYDLVLTGHAHGGVVRLPFTDGLLGPGHEFFPEHTAGAYTEGTTTMFVSRGLGDTDFPRFLNRPDMALLTLRTGEQAP